MANLTEQEIEDISEYIYEYYSDNYGIDVHDSSVSWYCDHETSEEYVLDLEHSGVRIKVAYNKQTGDIYTK